MKDDFYFWCFVLWLGSILVWGWTLTLKSKKVRTWLGGAAVIFSFIMSIILYPLLSMLSATYRSISSSSSIGMEQGVMNIMFLIVLFAPMFIMGAALKRSGSCQTDKDGGSPSTR